MITWDDSWPIGIKVVDDQHRRLVDLTNELAAAMLKGEGRNHVLKTFQELANYVHVHFTAEEALMEKMGYPGLAEQQKAHGVFKRNVAELIASYQTGNALVFKDVLAFLATWLREHTHGIDRKFGDYYLKHVE